MQTASIDWGDDNVPRSSLYGDVYYCREQGLAETRYVFLERNHLPARFSQLTAHDNFTIAETGFGTGLNFLATWQLWRETTGQASGCRLHFVSVEKHPLQKSDLARALAQWPELCDLSSTLLHTYPELVAGQHRLEFDAGRVVLDLIFDDAEPGLAALRSSIHPGFTAFGAKVDAWYLDGFAPGSNPGMWSDRLLDHIAALSKPGCSFATFTAAGFVKRGLQQRGFAVEKVAGFGRKRDMLRGEFCGPAIVDPAIGDSAIGDSAKPRLKKGDENAAWHLAPEQVRPRSVVVIGAGLAGCHTAAALAKRGLHVTVLEQHNAIASAASGNPQAILYTKLSHQAGQLNQFALTSFLYACRFYRQMPDLPGDLCGVLQLMGESQKDNFEKLRSAFSGQDNWCQFIDSGHASDIAGIPLNSSAIYFKQAGWLRPTTLCEQLLAQDNITVLGRHALMTIEQHESTWILRCENGAELEADAVILANSHDAGKVPQLAHLPLTTIRGQLTLLQASDFEQVPKCVICHEGYLAPPVDELMVIGASYDTNADHTRLRDEDNLSNLQKLREAVPGLAFNSAFNTEKANHRARAAIRCTTPDYLPLVGPAPISAEQLRRFAPLGKDARLSIAHGGAYYPGLYVNLAHGSRGLTSTPLAAELIAAQVCQELSPLPRDLVRALSPSRFLIRSLIRGR